VECLHFVPLAGGAEADEVPHEHAVTVDGEVEAEALEGLLDPFMARDVRELEHRRKHARHRWNVDARAIEDEAIDDKPRRATIRDNGVTELTQSGVPGKLGAQVVVEAEGWR
jgi:hypothetical protein